MNGDLSELERYLLDGGERPVCADEQAFYDCWHARELNALPPVSAALSGGLVADRLPWAFAAGYQATLRNAFPMLPGGGWAAFVANEDADDPRRFPGTTLRPRDDGDGLRLDGHKLWVAHSRLVDHLLVTVNDPGGDKYRARGVLVPRARPGVTLTHREARGFLAAMSQGFAAFDDVAVAPHEVFEFAPIRQFGRTEAKFVMLALTAFMLARTDAGAARDRLLALAAAIVALLGEADTSRAVYAAVDREFQHCADAFDGDGRGDEIPGYVTDAKVFRMYTARIQRREGYARAERAGGGRAR